MRSYLLAGIIFLISSCSFVYSDSPNTSVYGSTGVIRVSAPQNTLNLTVGRLSGERVMISWHAEIAPGEARFEVMRKHGIGIFTSLGVVAPKSIEDNSADYFFIDNNSFADSSFYCIKKINKDSVVFFSISKGIEGLGKER